VSKAKPDKLGHEKERVVAVSDSQLIALAESRQSIYVFVIVT
jgi:hypothetical protein